MIKIKHYGVILAIFLILFSPIAFSIFKPDVAGTADGLGHRFRLVSFVNSLSDGVLRPRWAGDAALGYGAPIFLFNYPLPYYIASIFVLAGSTINFAGQLLSFLSIFLSGIFMYLLARELFGKFGGITSAFAYTWVPYHLLMSNLYDAWGEVLAFAFPPLICYLMIKSIDRRSTANYLLLTISWFLFILSHNVSVLIFTPIILLFGFYILRWRLPVVINILMPFVAGIFLSAFFWLPAYFLQPEMAYPGFIISEGGLRSQFFKPLYAQISTAITVIRQGNAGYLDFTIGLPIVLAVVITFILMVRWIISFLVHRKEIIKGKGDKDLQGGKNLLNILLLGLLIVLAISLYLTNKSSDWLWTFLAPLKYIVYPFRFLFLASFTGSLLTGYICRKHILIAVCFCLLAIWQGLPYLRPNIDIFPFGNKYFHLPQTVSRAPLTQKNMLIREFLPTQANYAFLIKEEEEFYRKYFAGESDYKIEEAKVLNGDGEIIEMTRIAQESTITIKGKSDMTIAFHRFNFPDWEAYIDGNKASLISDSVGRINIAVPAGSHSVKLRFGVSKVEQIALSVSLVGIIFIIMQVFWLKESKQPDSKIV